MNKTSLDFPSGTVIADAGIARKGSDPSYSAGPSSATAIDGQAELVAGDEAGEIRQAYRDATGDLVRGLRKVIICGGLFIEQKERVGHGNFIEWMGKNLPEIPMTTFERWMNLAINLDSMIHIPHNGKFVNPPIYRLLGLPEGDISVEQQELVQKATEFLRGKTQKELLNGLTVFRPTLQPGGDNEYLTFCRERHPELIKANGKAPKRTAEFAKEFAMWQLKRMNPRARAEHLLKLANWAADNVIRAMKLASMDDILFKCSKDRLPELWDLIQKLNKIVRDARGGKTGTDGTDGS